MVLHNLLDTLQDKIDTPETGRSTSLFWVPVKIFITNLTGTFFCVTTTAHSFPLTATDVKPPWLMALKAYSARRKQTFQIGLSKKWSQTLHGTQRVGFLFCSTAWEFWQVLRTDVTLRRGHHLTKAPGDADHPHHTTRHIPSTGHEAPSSHPLRKMQNLCVLATFTCWPNVHIPVIGIPCI